MGNSKDIEYDDALCIEDKLRIIRTERNLPQSAFAEVCGCDSATISRIESNEERNAHYRYSAEQVRAIKGFLGIPNAPLSDKEMVLFKKQLYNWLSEIKAERINEARVLHQELADVLKQPFAKDLSLMYRLFEIRLLMKESNIDTASHNIEQLKAAAESTTDEIKYHYNFTAGSLCYRQRNIDEAFRHYQEADRIAEKGYKKEPTLYLNLALCHMEHGQYVRTAIMLGRAYPSFVREDEITVQGLSLMNQLADCYTRLGDTDSAMEILDKCLFDAKTIKHKTCIGFALHNYGCAYFVAKDYQKALDCFEDAFEYLGEGNWAYLENLYYKARCLVATKSPRRNEILSQGAEKSKGNHEYELLFNSLVHLATLREESSLQYIEGTTIPFLIEKCKYFKALDYCELLEVQYKKNRQEMNSLRVSALALEITKRTMKGGLTT